MINLRNIFVKTNIVLVFCLIWNHSSLAQSLFDTTYIDTIALKVKRDFDAQDFIRMTKEDTSFHRAFKNLKMYPHQSKNSVTIFNKTWDQIAQLKRTATHLSDGKLGSIQIDNETTDGKFYKKNGEHKYFTGEMFDKVFFEKGKFDVDNAVKTNYSQQKPDDRTKKEKYYEKLKTFMFSPGTGVDGVPLIGKKLNIYEGKMVQFYDFKLDKTFFKDSIPCYKFSCKKKADIKENKVVIQNVTTFYDRRTMKIIARSYALKDATSLFSFDIKMYIELKYEFNEYLPVKVKYNGEWDVPLQKPERIKFEILTSNYFEPKN